MNYTPPVQTADGQLVPISWATISSLSSAVGINPPAGATKALISAEGKDVYWSPCGAAPTATDGMPLAVGVPMLYVGDLDAIKFIETAASAKLRVAFYK